MLFYLHPYSVVSILTLRIDHGRGNASLPNFSLIHVLIESTQFVSARVYEMRAHMNAGKIGDSEKPMLLRLLQYKYASSSSEYMPDLDIISEAMGHMYGDSEIVAAVHILLMASAAFFFLQDCGIRYHDHLTLLLFLGAQSPSGRRPEAPGRARSSDARPACDP